MALHVFFVSIEILGLQRLVGRVKSSVLICPRCQNKSEWWKTSKGSNDYNKYFLIDSHIKRVVNISPDLTSSRYEISHMSLICFLLCYVVQGTKHTTEKIRLVKMKYQVIDFYSCSIILSAVC